MTGNKQAAKALVLSGGGVKGTFQFGAIEYIYENVLEDGEDFKIVCGVSAGALNGSMVAQGKLSEGNQLWMDQIQHRVPAFTQRYPWYLIALLALLPGIVLYLAVRITRSLFLNHRLRKVLCRYCSGIRETLRDRGVAFRVGIVDFLTGEYRSVDPGAQQDEKTAIDAILASTAIPVAFPAVQLDKAQAFDGGVINVTPFKDVFDVAESEDFAGTCSLAAIYAVMCSPLQPEAARKRFRGIFGIGERAIELLEKDIYLNDKKMFETANAITILRRELQSRIADPGELEAIYARVESLTGRDIRDQLFVPECKIVYPDPAQWLAFRTSGSCSTPLATAGDSGDSSALFWREFPTTLTRDRHRLTLAYEFGQFMAYRTFHGDSSA